MQRAGRVDPNPAIVLTTLGVLVLGAFVGVVAGLGVVGACRVGILLGEGGSHDKHART